jgi:hypothetical protein
MILLPSKVKFIPSYPTIQDPHAAVTESLLLPFALSSAGVVQYGRSESFKIETLQMHLVSIVLIKDKERMPQIRSIELFFGT